MSDTTTRSGMLWEVERILTECKELGTLPQILLMENVPQVKTNDPMAWERWLARLEELGYRNYHQDLIATDYGIPQTRNRCFMVSLLGDYNYTFPKPIPLKLKLKDLLEDNVDEKYYLSDAMIKCFTRETEDDKFPRGDRFKQALKLTNEKNLAGTITTAAGNRATDNFILTNKSLQKTLEQNKIDDTCYIDTYNKRIDKEKSGTITTGVSFRNNTFLAIKNATSKGYLEATDGDGVDISSRMEYHRGTVQKGKTQTLTTMGGENNGVVVIGNYSPSNHEASRIVDIEYVAPTIKENHGTITAIQDKPKVLGGIGEKKSNGGTQWYQQNRIYDDKVSISITTDFNPYYKTDLRIRKLTPRECFRLMGVKDEDFDKVAKNQSDSSLYHLAGDSIVVNVLMAIFKEMI